MISQPLTLQGRDDATIDEAGVTPTFYLGSLNVTAAVLAGTGANVDHPVAFGALLGLGQCRGQRLVDRHRRPTLLGVDLVRLAVID